jgi:hypothetical protein
VEVAVSIRSITRSGGSASVRIPSTIQR